MKQFTFITMISLLIPLLGISQTKTTVIDDVYLKPSDVKVQPANPSQNTKPKVNYKNGAREIVYIERENPNAKVIHDTVYVVGQANENFTNRINKGVHDTIYVVGQANDSTENSQVQGYYLNGFKGTQSDLEYAERIRRFHNPKYQIFVGDPRYNDIYFLNDNDWNVYVDGSYAYVTPTWTNPYWWNYNYSPYSYGNWGYGFNNFYSPFSCYSGWYSPWGFDNFYGGFGYGGYGYCGYGYGGYGYGGYGYGGYGYGGYGYGGYGYGGYGGYGYSNSVRNPNHDEGTRRDVSNSAGTGRVGGMGNSSQSMSGGGGYSSTNPYTVISNSGSRASQQSVVNNASGTRSTNNPSNISSPGTLSTSRNGIGLVRTGGLRNLSGLNQNNGANMGSRSATTYTINTSPRTTVTRNSPTSVTTSSQGYVNPGNSRTSYSTSTTNSGNYSTGSRSSSPTISNSNSSRSSSSYNSGNSNYSAPSSSSNSGSRSSSSYSGGGSSGGSSSGSSSGGGSRSSGGGGGGSRR